MTDSLPAYMFGEEIYDFTVPVVVVLKRPWEDYSDDERTLLQKILASVKTDINSVQIMALPSVNPGSLRPSGASRVLIFGADTGESIAPYQATAAHGLSIICADDLSELNDDRKKNLWLALRQMFGV